MNDLIALKGASESLSAIIEEGDQVALGKLAGVVQYLGNKLYQSGTSVAQLNRSSKFQFEEFGGAALLKL